MRRLVRILMIAVPLVLLIGVIVFSLLLGRLVKISIEHYVPQMTETEVRIESAHFNPLIGRIRLKGAEVDNPEGFSDGQAFTFGEVGVLIRLGSLFSNEIHIREIRLREPEVFYERRLRSSNISKLVENIEASTRSDRPQTERIGEKDEVRFRIDRLLIEEGRIAIGVGPGAVRLTLPQVDMSEMGSEGRGLTLDQTVLLVLRIIGRSVGDAVTDVPGNVFDRIRGIFQRENGD
ncbi:MAG: hypothetical protein JJU20_01060 [Opitutales bacterium]|nr:hypothetical protein [Opitutales bacterium]